MRVINTNDLKKISVAALRLAAAETQSDYKAKRYVLESVEKHIKRIASKKSLTL